MQKEKFLKVFMVMSILFMLMPAVALAEKIPVAILRTNADGKTKTLTFTYAERPKVFAKRGQNGIHRLNKGMWSSEDPNNPEVQGMMEDIPTWISLQNSGPAQNHPNNAKIITVIFDKTFDQARPTSTSYWFWGFKKLTTIKGIENLNTSNVKYMVDMFGDCLSLKKIDVSGLNTSNVNEMFGMFEGCSSIDSLDVSGFNTSNVTVMSNMFKGCSNLQCIDVTGFNTEKVVSIGGMFEGCSNLKTVDVSGFKTSSIYDMVGMFKDCSSLSSIDISNFNMSNVNWVREMFSGCVELGKIVVGSNDFTNLSEYSYLNKSVKAQNQRDNAFQKVGTADNPCLLIVDSDFNKSVLGVKHENGKGGFYRWLDGYFTLEVSDGQPSDSQQPTAKAISDNGDNTIYYDSQVDEKASFPGGWKAYGAYSDDNIITSPNGKRGNIMMTAVVEKDGSISNIKVVYSPDVAINETAKQMAKQMPKWIPAKKGGLAVRSQVQLYYNVKK